MTPRTSTHCGQPGCREPWDVKMARKRLCFGHFARRCDRQRWTQQRRIRQMRGAA
jgi:hypothetical protein